MISLYNNLFYLFISEGIAVGVAPGKDLKSLIPALAFHQFFEGVALGARLANVCVVHSINQFHLLAHPSPKVGFSGFIEVLLTIIYSISAPIGIGIGIGVHNSYNPNSAKANYIQGTFDAIAAGSGVLSFQLLKKTYTFPRNNSLHCLCADACHWFYARYSAC